MAITLKVTAMMDITMSEPSMRPQLYRFHLCRRTRPVRSATVAIGLACR